MLGVRALGALPYTGRPETAVTGALKWYLKWPSNTNNNAIVQLSGIGSTPYMTLVFAEDVIDPNAAAYIFDGRRALNTTAEGNGGYLLKFGGAVQVSAASNFTLNGATSDSGAWRTAKAGDRYKFLFDAGTDGVVSVGGRFSQIDGFPLLALRQIIIDDANGSHVIDLTNKGGLSQFTSNDLIITATLFGFNLGSCWIPTLDTTVSNSLVNQGVNGTAANFCVLNGTSYFTAPSLGNLHSGSPKIRINIKNFKWLGTSVQPIFWQGGTSWANRELALRNNSGVGNIICGTGSAAGFTWSDLTNAFGDANLTCDEFGFELDGTVAKFYKNKQLVFSVSGVTRGTGRLNGALFFIGAHQNDDLAGSTAAINIVPSGTQYGDIEILINDVVVRNYKNIKGDGDGYIDTLQSVPYALRYENIGNRYMALPQGITIADNQDFEIEFECAFNNDTDFRIFGTTASVSNRIILLKGAGATIVRVTPSSGSPADWTVTYTKTAFNVFRFKRTSNVVELFVNGISQGTITFGTGFNGINALFTQGGFYSDSGTVRYLKFTIGTTLAHHYINLTGAGQNWVDIVSGNTATPINSWPTNNSQWIAYQHLQQRGTFTTDNSEWRQFILSSVAAAIRAIIMNQGTLQQIPDNLVGTGRKPIVVLNGELRERATTEGTPVVYANGGLRTLASNESLLI